MSELAEYREERLGRYARTLFPTTITVSGSEWSRAVTCSNSAALAFADHLAVSTRGEFQLISAGVQHYGRMTVMPAAILPAGATEKEYDPAFVAEILAADAAPAEEGFDNVVDLLDWLNRD